MVRAINLSFSYGGEPIFDRINFTVGRNQKVGLVGPNGSGKTTLFKLITEREVPDAGKVEVVGNIGMVPQEVKYDPDVERSRRVRDYLDPGNRREDFELKRMLSRLELNEVELNSKPASLSGGQKTKLALVKALITQPDILLLDEPTNFMDLPGKKWVMNFLSNYAKTLILISHDLELLDKYIDKVLYINTQTKNIEEYKGNYSKFKKLQAEREALQKRQRMASGKHIKRLEKSSQKVYKNVRQRVQLQKRIEKERANLPALPKEIQVMKVDFPTPSRLGGLPLKVIGVSKSYGNKKVFENVSFSITRGEKIALIGPNGSGKSTLLKILVGIIQPDDGQVIRDRNLKLGYYSQEFETFNFDEEVIDIAKRVSCLGESKLRALLARFLFDRNKIGQKIGSLSGGERTRLSIVLLVIQDHNLLILDEPTTYLDPISQRIVLEALKDYEGAMIIVSHIPQFIVELNPDRALLLPENKITFWSSELIPKVSEV